MPIITVHPSEVISGESSFNSVDSGNPFSNAVGKGVANSTYAQWYMNTGYNAVTKVLYAFDLSGLPEDAIITQVSCQAKCQVQNSSTFRVSSRQVILYSGSTQMAASSSSAFGTSATTVTVPEATWTVEQLKNARISINATRGFIGTSTQYYVRLYGADLTVTYELPPDQTLYKKIGNSYVSAKATYKKVGGTWVKQTDLSQVFDSNVKYICK